MASIVTNKPGLEQLPVQRPGGNTGIVPPHMNPSPVPGPNMGFGGGGLQAGPIQPGKTLYNTTGTAGATASSGGGVQYADASSGGGTQYTTAAPQTGGNLPATPVPTTTSAPLQLRGSDYVAHTVPGTGTSAGPAQVINQLDKGLGRNAQLPPSSAISALQKQFGFTPDMSPEDMIKQINSAFGLGNQPGAGETANNIMNAILGSGSQYMTNAAQRGLETAGSRGMLNSSIAGGSAQRAAVESATPMFQAAMGLQGQREGQDFQATMQSRNQAFGIASEREQQAFQEARDAFAAAAQLTGQDRQNAFQAAQQKLQMAYGLQQQREQNAFTGQESALNRTQSVNNAMLGAQLQDWLGSNSFSREFNGMLQMMPIQNAMDLTRMISQLAMQDPELYTPQIVSGMTEFFNKNMQAIMAQFFKTGGNP